VSADEERGARAARFGVVHVVPLITEGAKLLAGLLVRRSPSRREGHDDGASILLDQVTADDVTTEDLEPKILQ
jgi:hypothetical protein